VEMLNAAWGILILNTFGGLDAILIGVFDFLHFGNEICKVNKLIVGIAACNYDV
jgi:hypothetical protein